jgi:hypothetical protein
MDVGCQFDCASQENIGTHCWMIEHKRETEKSYFSSFQGVFRVFSGSFQGFFRDAAKSFESKAVSPIYIL